jgi:hypothetical protein
MAIYSSNRSPSIAPQYNQPIINHLNNHPSPLQSTNTKTNHYALPLLKGLGCVVGATLGVLTGLVTIGVTSPLGLLIAGIIFVTILVATAILGNEKDFLEVLAWASIGFGIALILTSFGGFEYIAYKAESAGIKAGLTGDALRDFVCAILDPLRTGAIVATIGGSLASLSGAAMLPTTINSAKPDKKLAQN